MVFDLSLYTRQIPDFRQAICSIVNANRELFTAEEASLFHNHSTESEDGLRHSPALIHYRVEKSRLPMSQAQNGDNTRHLAQLYGIGQGATAIQKLLAIPEKPIYIGKRDLMLKTKDFAYKTHSLRPEQQPRMYKLKRWVALSPIVYKDYWLTAKNMEERLRILNKRLNLHLQNLAEALDWQLDEGIQAEVQYIRAMHNVKVWNQKMIAFDIDYTVPLHLPPAIAIGRAVSHGFGVQYPVR
jgi:hypothetical protein